MRIRSCPLSRSPSCSFRWHNVSRTAAFVVMTVMTLMNPHPVSAWIATTATTTSKSTTTRLEMFDWLSQPKPRRTGMDEPSPVHPTTTEHGDHAHQHQQHHPKNPFKEAEDFVSNWFQGFSSSTGRSNDLHDNEHHVPQPSPHEEQDDQTDHMILSRTTRTPTPTISINADAVPVTTLTPSSSASSPTERVAAAPEIKIHSGHVAWFDVKKGYGFLLVDNKVEDQDNGVQDNIFVHYSAISTPHSQQQGTDTDNDTGAAAHELTLFRKLVRNEPVEFQLITTAGGKKKAVHVTGPDGTPVQYIREQLIRRTVVPPADATQDNNNDYNDDDDKHRNE